MKLSAHYVWICTSGQAAQAWTRFWIIAKTLHITESQHAIWLSHFLEAAPNGTTHSSITSTTPGACQWERCFHLSLSKMNGYYTVILNVAEEIACCVHTQNTHLILVLLQNGIECWCSIWGRGDVKNVNQAGLTKRKKMLQYRIEKTHCAHTPSMQLRSNGLATRCWVFFNFNLRSYLAILYWAIVSTGFQVGVGINSMTIVYSHFLLDISS